MLSVVTMEKVLKNMMDKTYVKPFSEYYVSSRAIVVGDFVLTLSGRAQRKYSSQTEQMKQALQLFHATALYTQIKRHLLLLDK
jgi:hypothetical protein